jgi:Ca2+-binding EF-hand superfamily protein
MVVMMSFYQRCEELEELRKIFLALDKSNDGLLTLDEVHEGLTTVMG